VSTTHHLQSLCASVDDLERAINRLSHVPKFLRDAITTAKGRRIAAARWAEATAEVQSELFGSTPPSGLIPTGQTETSLEAAYFQSKSGKAASDRQKILFAISIRPRSVDALERDLGMSHQTCSARVHGLNKDGLIVDSTRRQRTRAGRQAIVWEVTPAGREAIKNATRPR